MTNAEAWIARVTHLNQWRRHGERAPHKPLLLLYALAKLQQTGNSLLEYTKAERDLQSLLDEFGPPRRTSPSYPFHHLVSDGLWTVRTKHGDGSPGDSRGVLRSSGAVGSLAPEFVDALERSPGLFAAIVSAILQANFPETLHADILAALGLSLDLPDSELEPKLARRRNPAFREKVLLAYEYRCAICGYDGQLERLAVGIEAAHIRWWQALGPTEVSNALALCSLHHKLLDAGVIGVTSEYFVQVSSHFIGRSDASVALVLAFAGRPLIQPQPGQSGPDPEHVRWHEREVFRPPARGV